MEIDGTYIDICYFDSDTYIFLNRDTTYDSNNDIKVSQQKLCSFSFISSLIVDLPFKTTFTTRLVSLTKIDRSCILICSIRGDLIVYDINTKQIIKEIKYYSDILTCVSFTSGYTYEQVIKLENEPIIFAIRHKTLRKESKTYSEKECVFSHLNDILNQNSKQWKKTNIQIPSDFISDLDNNKSKQNKYIVIKLLDILPDGSCLWACSLINNWKNNEQSTKSNKGRVNEILLHWLGPFGNKISKEYVTSKYIYSQQTNSTYNTFTNTELHNQALKYELLQSNQIVCIGRLRADGRPILINIYSDGRPTPQNKSATAFATDMNKSFIHVTPLSNIYHNQNMCGADSLVVEHKFRLFRQEIQRDVCSFYNDFEHLLTDHQMMILQFSDSLDCDLSTVSRMV